MRWFVCQPNPYSRYLEKQMGVTQLQSVASSRHEVRTVVDSGIDDFLLKPGNAPDLRDKLHNFQKKEA